jgi:uncharacterized membrane protein YphA (DoxX/SURF4 family)
MAVVSPAARTRWRTASFWATASVLAIFFVLMGIPKVFGQTGWVSRFAAWGYPDWFAAVVGLGEIAGALLLIVPSFSGLGAALLATIMAGAAATHLWHGELARIVPPMVLLALLALVWKTRNAALSQERTA